MIVFCPNPTPCHTPLGDAYVWYIKDNGMFENNEYACVMCKDGSVKHFLGDAIQIWFNATYQINKIRTNAKANKNQHKRHTKQYRSNGSH